MEPVITVIYPSNITTIWPQVVPLLEPALAQTKTHTIEDIRKSILCGNAQLWVQWSDKVDAAVITEFKNYPQGTWFNFWLAGALKGAAVFWDKFFNTLYEFAKNNGCKGIEDCGRAGWDKYAPQAEKVAIMRRIEIKENCNG